MTFLASDAWTIDVRGQFGSFSGATNEYSWIQPASANTFVNPTYSFYPNSSGDSTAAVVKVDGDLGFARLTWINGYNTVTHTLEIGRRIRTARESQLDPVKGVLEFLNSPADGRYARELFNGRIVDVLHETRAGWHWGRVLISSGAGQEPEFLIEIQNEYLVARHNGRTVTIVPDLIAILDAESAEPLTAEMLAYGQRVRVIGYSAAPIMRRPESLKVFGPRLFGLDEDFRPVEDLAP